MGNAGSMDQQTDFRGHNMPLKLPMPEPGELEERFAIVLVCSQIIQSTFLSNPDKFPHLFFAIPTLRWHDSCVGLTVT